MRTGSLATGTPLVVVSLAEMELQFVAVFQELVAALFRQNLVADASSADIKNANVEVMESRENRRTRGSCIFIAALKENEAEIQRQAR
jgi:hypothetical protein